MLGHADTSTTMIYLGPTVDDIAKVQEKWSNYLEMIGMKVKANPQAYQVTVRPTLFAR